MNKSILGKLSRNKPLNFVVQIFFDFVLTIIRFLSKTFFKKGDCVCVISIHKLGDSIFTFDAINSIKSFYNKDVFIICHYNAKEIYALIHPENLIVPIPKESFHFNDRYLDSRARKLLKSLNPEVIIDLTGVMTSASLIFSSGARQIIGMNRKIFRSIFDVFNEVDTNLRSEEIYIRAIEKIIPIKRINRSSFNAEAKIERILIAPFAGWKSKEWGLSKFIRLAERLLVDYDIELIFDNTFIQKDIFQYLEKSDIKFFVSKSIKDLIEKIKKADLIIGNDSGPVQIAAFLGKKTFSIYGPTNPNFHLPKGESHNYVQKILPCSPKQDERLCFTDGGKSGCPSFECMNLLSFDEVYYNLKNLFL